MFSDSMNGGLASILREVIGSLLTVQETGRRTFPARVNEPFHPNMRNEKPISHSLQYLRQLLESLAILIIHDDLILHRGRTTF